MIAFVTITDHLKEQVRLHAIELYVSYFFDHQYRGLLSQPRNNGNRKFTIFAIQLLPRIKTVADPNEVTPENVQCPLVGVLVAPVSFGRPYFVAKKPIFRYEQRVSLTQKLARINPFSFSSE